MCSYLSQLVLELNENLDFIPHNVIRTIYFSFVFNILKINYTYKNLLFKKYNNNSYDPFIGRYANMFFFFCTSWIGSTKTRISDFPVNLIDCNSCKHLLWYIMWVLFSRFLTICNKTKYHLCKLYSVFYKYVYESL